MDFKDWVACDVRAKTLDWESNILFMLWTGGLAVEVPLQIHAYLEQGRREGNDAFIWFLDGNRFCEIG